MDRSTIRNIILVLFLLGALFVLYNVVLVGDGSFSVFSAKSNRSEQTAIVTELLSLLKVLEEVKLDTSFMENDLFKTLEDNSVELVPQPTGRQNPFIPI